MIFSSKKKVLSAALSLAMIGTMAASVPFSASADSTAPATTPVGVSYSAHVQSIGWMTAVKDGADAGTEGKALRMEALKVNLTGTLPTGASIVYQAHVQHYGWMTPVADGAEAGTDGQAKRVESLKFALKNLPGYAVMYKVHQQKTGWSDWFTTDNGTDISKAVEAGVTGKSLRLEAVEIKIVKTAATVAAVNGTIAVGGQTTFAFKDADGNAYTPTTTPTYKVEDSTFGSVNADGTFTAAKAGVAKVDITVDGQTLVASVNVYGEAAGVKLSADSANLLANGKAVNAITATVVDANGNTVSNFNGTITVAGTAATVDNGNGGVPASKLTNGLVEGGTLSGNNVVFTVVNGVATVKVAAGSATAGNSDTIVTSALVSTNGQGVATNLSYGSFKVNYVSVVASKLALAVSTGCASSLSVNGTAPQTSLDLQLQDATGTKVSTLSGYVTLTLTGPASFDAANTITTETVYVSNGEASVTVYGKQGVTGSIVATATSADGYTAATLTVPAVINTAAKSIAVTSKNDVTPTGKAFTLYTVSLLDSNGNVIDNNADKVAVTDNADKALTYQSVLNGQPNGTLESKTLTFANGVAQFAVETATVGTSPVTLSFAETDNSFTTTSTYNYQSGNATQIATIDTVPAACVEAGKTLTWSVQLEDATGNVTKQAGTPVTFAVSGNTSTNAAFANGATTGSYTVNTDANGIATVTMTVPSTALAGSFTLTANYNNSTASVTEKVVSAADYVTAVKYATNWTSTSVVANNAFTAPVLNAVNAINANVSGTNIDVYEVISSDPTIVSLSGTGTPVSGATAGSAYLESASSSGVVALPTITGLKAGSATLTVKDLSNPEMPSVTTTLTVTVGAAAGNVVEYNGKLISTTNSLSVTKNTPVAVQIVNVDAGNNPVAVTGATGLNVKLTDSNGGQFRATADGAPVSTVTIPANQNSVTVYYVNPATMTITSGLTAVPATGVAGASAITTPGRAASDAVAGVYNVTFGGTWVPANDKVTIDGTELTLSAATTGAAVATEIKAAVNANNTLKAKYLATDDSNGKLTLTQVAGQESSTAPVIAKTSSAGTVTAVTTVTPGAVAGAISAEKEVATLTISSAAAQSGTVIVTVTNGNTTTTYSVGVTAGDSVSTIAQKIAGAVTISGYSTLQGTGSANNTVTFTASATGTQTTHLSITVA